jgi:hypothetical protein
MTESTTHSTFCVYGFASDNTLVYVDQEAYLQAPAEFRDNANWWLEQIGSNDAVWTENVQ